MSANGKRRAGGATRLIRDLDHLTDNFAGVSALRRAIFEIAVTGELTAGTLQSAWRRVPLADFGEFSGGSTPSKARGAFWGGDVPWISPKDMKTPEIGDTEDKVTRLALSKGRLRLLPTGSVVLVVRSGILRRTVPVAVTTVSATLNQDMKGLIPRADIDPRFVRLLFRGCERTILETYVKGGTTVQSIKWDQLLALELPLPPLAEQKRIVAKVDQLMALCDDLEAKQTKKRDLATQSTRSALTALTTAENADDLAAAWRRVAKNFGDVLGDAQAILALKDAVLALAVRGQIENAAPGDESIEHVADRLSRARDGWAVKAQGNHDAFPEVVDAPFEVARWRWIRLGNLAEIVGGVAKGRKLPGRQVSSFPYLRVANVQRGFLDLTVMKELEILREELPRYRLLPNDVLFTEGGDWDKLGRSAVWPGEIDPCIHQNHIFRARLLTNDLDPRWVSMFCNSPVGRAYFEDAAKQTTNLATINMTELRHCPIPVPPPQEQRRILDRLHQMMSLLDDLEAKLRKQEQTATRLAESLAAAVAA